VSAKTVTIEQWKFDLDDFCKRLGIPESDAPDLFMVNANPVGVSIAFVHRVSAGESLQWDRSWWSARRFCKRLGLPGGWGSHMVSSWPDLGHKTITLRFAA
jgi:hypothetical protein